MSKHNILVEKFAVELNQKILGISPRVLEKIMLNHWSGSVRELENAIKRMVAISDTCITEASLSPHITTLKTKVNSVDNDLSLNDQTLKQKVEEIEAKIITETLVRQRWNQSKTASELGLSRVGLANKIKRYELVQKFNNISEFDDKQRIKNNQSIVKFPQTRTQPKTSKPETQDLGVSRLAQQLGCDQSSLKGHWCSQCKGIWYGNLGECECPVCGNRHG